MHHCHMTSSKSSNTSNSLIPIYILSNVTIEIPINKISEDIIKTSLWSLTQQNSHNNFSYNEFDKHDSIWNMLNIKNCLHLIFCQ